MSKGIKIFFAVIIIAVVTAAFMFVNAFYGNPLSTLLCKRTAENFITENFADMDLYVESAGYNFKDGSYYAHIKSPSSIDTYFSVYTSWTGKLQGDNYDDYVKSGWNTWQRLDDEYRKRTAEVFDADDFPYKSDIAFGTISLLEKSDDNVRKQYGVTLSELELDKKYDIDELAKSTGEIVFYAKDDELTVERAGEIMLDLKKILDEKKIQFYAIDFVLQKQGENEKPVSEGQINVEDFLYSDIYEDGMTSRVQKANDELTEYYEKMDKEKTKAIN